MRTTNRTCRWCGHVVCHGHGFLNDAGAGDPCGAVHARRGRGRVSIEQDIRSHACARCGAYTCGIHCLSGGLCPACAAPAEAREVLESEQAQPRRSR